MVLGIIVVYACNTLACIPAEAKNIAGYFGILTDIFLRLIKMIIAPLVFATLVAGLAGMGDSKTVGRIGAKALGWFVVASRCSLTLGLVFAGMALFADTARSLARRAVVALDGWSQALAEARAETRLWELARMDHRLMTELQAARTRAQDEQEAAAPVPQSFDEALAPLGLPEAPKVVEQVLSHWERVGMARARRQLAQYY